MNVDMKDIASSFQIIGHSVTELSIITNKTKNEGPHNIHFNFDYDITKHTEESNRIGNVLLSINSVCKNEAHELFSMSFKIDGEFTASADTEDEMFIRMLEINGLTVLIQIARTFMLSVTSLWGIGPAIVLPMINVHELIKSKKETAYNKQISDNIRS